MDSLEKKIARINELYHKAKAEGLTEEEKKEQASLRSEYIANIRANLRGQLNNIDIQERMVPLRIWGKGMETKARIRQRMLALRDAMQIQERKGKSAKDHGTGDGNIMV